MRKLYLPILALLSLGAHAQVLAPSNNNSNSLRRMETNTVSAAPGGGTNASTATAKREVATLAGGCFWGRSEEHTSELQSH